jgi:hypothetical protein
LKVEGRHKRLRNLHSSFVSISRIGRECLTWHWYEATRGVWKVGPRREDVNFALAIYKGVVIEVFEIHDWHPAGSTTFLDNKLTDQ